MASENVYGTRFAPSNASDILFTNGITSPDDRQRMEGFFAWNRGLISVLPAGHVYQNLAP